jgi:hypothetical protein
MLYNNASNKELNTLGVIYHRLELSIVIYLCHQQHSMWHRYILLFMRVLMIKTLQDETILSYNKQYLIFSPLGLRMNSLLI